MTVPAAPVGYFAASLVFATFCTKRMVSLRTLAIASNVAFIAYAYLDSLWPILILHCALLPLNVLRLQQELAPAPPSSSLPRLNRSRCRAPCRPERDPAPTVAPSAPAQSCSQPDGR